jgi:Protein of unknown function (DUF642)/PEP-CTERM motif
MTETLKFNPASLALAACLAAASLAPAHADNLFVNGSFETPTLGYQALPGGSTAISGWTTVLSGVEHFSPSAYGVGAAADGLMVVDLANYTYLSGGGIEQTVATTAGQTYEIRFFAGTSLYAGRDGTGIVKVSVDGGTPWVFDTAVAGSATIAWAERSFSFVAADSASTVRFWNDQNPYQHFANIDGVALVAAPVPEPQTWLLMSAGLLAAASLRRRHTAR